LFSSVLISLLAGILGAALAAAGSRVTTANFLPIEGKCALRAGALVHDWAFARDGFAMGLYPALQSSRADIVDALKEGGAAPGSVRQQRFRKILVSAQVALSVTPGARRCSSRVSCA
jgi:hypothetical protein